MPLQAPVRVWRFLLADLVRLGVLAGASLVVVISFAFSVRFLAEGRIDLPGALRLSVLAMVPMLQYALPFACGFAATLAYHRFASDNEATACSAGGISHRAVLVPAAVVGLVLAVAVAVLAHQVIPRFLRKMEEIVTRDLTGLITLSIRRGESV
ncbi:MAG: LptF/LptG family permease, partial [Phycisphaerae bacterium]|nr:LptF/LptG family permease [Phycisphaerae bacterium]